MKTSIRLVLFLGALYFATGIVLGSLAGQAATVSARNAWRWGAWLVSIIAFCLHISVELRRLNSRPSVAARQAATASALGAFLLAVAANVHALLAASTRPSLLLVLSLVIWPVMTFVSAFVVALVIALLLARLWRRA